MLQVQRAQWACQEMAEVSGCTDPAELHQDEREGSNQSLATMEKKYTQHLQEMTEIYKTELLENKEVFKNQMAAEEQRCF